MPINDYAEWLQTGVPVKEHDVVSGEGDETIINKYELMFLKNGINYLKFYALPFINTNNSVSKNYTDVINKPIFKYTKLREDIHIITTKIIDENNNVLDFKFAVNDKSIWKRFNFYNNNGIKVVTESMSVGELVRKVSNNELIAKLYLFKFEEDELAEISQTTEPNVKFFKTGITVKFYGDEYHSKLLWLKLFNNTDTVISQEINDLNLGLESYRVQGSNTYFDITSKENSKYSCFVS